MVVAVALMRIMQVPIHQIIHVIPMRNRFMPAAFPMRMTSIVTGAIVGHTLRRVGCGDFNNMLVEMIAMRAVQVAIVQIIDVVPMLHRRMSAPFPMDV